MRDIVYSLIKWEPDMMTHVGLYPTIPTEKTACERPGGMTLKTRGRQHVNYQQNTQQEPTSCPQGPRQRHRRYSRQITPSARTWRGSLALEAELEAANVSGELPIPTACSLP